MKTIKNKLLLVVLLVFGLQAILLGFLSKGIYENYQEMQLAECRAKVEQKTAEMMLTIALFKEKAERMAHFGRLTDDNVVTQPQLDAILLEALRDFTPAVGGGIWYEPYQLDPKRRRACSYLFQTTEGHEVDAAFQSDAYDYHNQLWYRQIKAQLEQDRVPYGWTQPYRDAAGSNAWMITVGAGIYDAAGRFVGMATVDWEADDLIAAFNQIKPTENSVILLYGRHGGVFMLAGREIRSVAPEDCRFDPAVYEEIAHEFSDDMKVAVYAPKEEIFAFINERMRMTVAILLGVCALLVAALYRLLYALVSRPVKTLAQAAQALGAGDFSVRAEVGTKDELGRLAEVFNKMAADLKSHIAMIAQITAERERLSAELQVAREIQASMLPCIFPPFPERPDVDIFASMEPAREVGGDFYDFFLVDESHIAVVIADVSGKGIPAALFMVIAKTLLKNQGLQKQSPARIFATVNDQLCENNEAGMFVTAFLGILDLRTGCFTYVNGGHNPPYWRKACGEVVSLASSGDLLLAGIKNAAYHERSVTLQSGDLLFLYTDGVTEAMNPAQEMFGENRLEAVLRESAALSPRALTLRVKDALADFVQGGESFDDVTLMAVAFRKPETAAADRGTDRQQAAAKRIAADMCR